MKRKPLQVNIKMTTATELCQIDKSEPAKAGVPSKIVPITQKVVTENSKGYETSFYTPIFSGNSIRGEIRRLSLAMLMEKATEANIDMPSNTDFNLMNVGGGNDFQTQPYNVEDEVREANPVVSLLGASLAISGKLVTPNCMPFRDTEGVKEYYTAETEEGKLYSPIKHTEDFYKKDDILDREGNAKYLSPQQREEWRQAVEENQEKVAKTRDTDKKEKKSSIRAHLQREYVVRGIDFYTAFSEIQTTVTTAIERGMLYLAIERLVMKSIGSNKSRGFGLMEYNIAYQDGSTLITEVDKFLVPTIIKKDYKEEVSSDIKAFEQWLENDFGSGTFEISKILVQK